MRRQDPGGIGAGPEERGMPKRGDAAIAGHQIERQDEQGDRDYPRQQREIVGEGEVTDRADGCDHGYSDEVATEAALMLETFAFAVHDKRHFISSFRQGRAGRRR